MQREVYTRASDGAKFFRPVVQESEFSAAYFGLDNPGFCVECGAETDGVEPDARKYRRGECGLSGVYGLEELILMGLVRIGEVEA